MCEKLFQKKNESVQAKTEQSDNTAQEMGSTPEPANEPVTAAGINALYQRMGRWIRHMAAGSQCSSTIRRSH